MLASQYIEERSAVQWVAKNALPAMVRRKIVGADVVLDVGSGIEPQTLVWPKVHICVEVHDEYVKYLNERLSGSSRYLIIRSPWEDALRMMPERSVDTVLAVDFIEHLPKASGLAFIAEAERIARRQVVLFTPLGYFPQTYEDPAEEDRWGMHGGHWQTHRSGWTPEDFSSDWEILGCRDYHTEGQRGPLDEPIGCFWAIRTRDCTGPEPRFRTPMEWRLWQKTMVHRRVPTWCRPALRGIKRLLLPSQG